MPKNFKPDCIFCQIANHKLKGKIINENEQFVAFYDIKPMSQGHTLVIPKQHIDDFNHLVQQESTFMKKYLEFINQTKNKLAEQYHPQGVRILFNTDKLIEVWHLHAHLIPVYD